MRSTRIPWLFTLLITTACGGEDASPETGAGGGADDGPTARLVATVDGLAGPEAVKYDPEQDVYFVANFGPTADSQRDANGFISRVGPDGAIQDRTFITGSEAQPLHMPRGMAIQGDRLWVADVDGIHAFDRITGEALTFVDFRSFEPGFLNDIAIAPDGTVFITDTGRGRVYEVRNGTPAIAVEDDRTGPPNGITWDAGRATFLLAPWGGGQIIRAWTAEGGFEDVVTVDGGNFDGIEVVGDRIILASQNDSSLWVVAGGTPRRVARLGGQPADIGVDAGRGHVAIPYISRNLVEIWEVPGLGRGEG